jgi:hypothetical protein
MQAVTLLPLKFKSKTVIPSLYHQKSEQHRNDDYRGRGLFPEVFLPKAATDGEEDDQSQYPSVYQSHNIHDNNLRLSLS